jgi:putative transposase
LGIGIDGTKHPLGLVEGSTENTTVVTDLGGLGLDTSRPILVGIDGGKALHAAVVAVFEHPVIQRCKTMRDAHQAPSAIIAEAQLRALVRELEHIPPALLAACARAWPRRWPCCAWVCHLPWLEPSGAQTASSR